MRTRDDLHGYQHTMEDWIIKKPRCGLFAECGLGKTIATLSAIKTLLDKFEVFHVLIVAPKRVAAEVWGAESSKWGHTKALTVQHIAGTPKQRIKLLEAPPPDITTIGVDLLPWLIDHLRDRWPYDAVVLDESSLFKNWSSKRVKKLKQISPMFDRLVLLTGTPCSNGLENLFSQIYFIDHGERLGTGITKFRNRWFNQSWNGFSYTPRPGAEEEIKGRIKDVCLSLAADDYLELPRRVDNVVTLSMPAALRNQYKELERHLVLQMDDDTITAATRAVLVNKLLQFCSGTVYDENKQHCDIHTLKLDALSDIIDAAVGQPVLIVYAFKHELARIKKGFPHVETMDNAGVIDRWNRKEVQLLAIHPASAGHGLNLAAGGNTMVWFSLTYDLELFTQTNARLHRQGQTKPTIIHYLTLDRTIEQDVLTRLENKKCTQNDLMDALKQRHCLRK